jgi:hypothetical protein
MKLLYPLMLSITSNTAALSPCTFSLPHGKVKHDRNGFQRNSTETKDICPEVENMI